ncbi:oligoendopeptidase F [Actinomycetes bacterium]|jgi:pepF/M3 family oligoendopeptidase|nr:oligoendopeptidase F [Actinomycetes bacterium]
MTFTAENETALPRWSVADVHESFNSRSFTDAMERAGSNVARLEALFETHNIRSIEPRTPNAQDGAAADVVIKAFNKTVDEQDILISYIYATVSTDSRHEQAQGLLSEMEDLDARISPLLARLADWVASLDANALKQVSDEAREHLGPLLRLQDRAIHQMSEAEEGLYAELGTTGSSAWGRLQSDLTSQLSVDVHLPSGTKTMPMAAVRGLATDNDLEVRKAAYEAEMRAWPTVAVACAAAMNSIKGEANTVNKRRQWKSPIDASLYSNSVSNATFTAMQSAISASLPDFRRWMRVKAQLHGDTNGLSWWNLFAPLHISPGAISWDEGISLVKDAFSSYSDRLAQLVDRSIDEQWLDAEPREGKTGGAFCMSFVDDRSLVLLNWSGSVDSAQTTAHELGHAYHNTQLANRTPLQKRLPMALAETASIFCETLVVEDGLSRMQGDERLALLDVNLIGASQVVVDIHSRFLFETEVFARRQRRTLGVSEFNEIMLQAQSDAYGDGLDQSTRHPHMWVLKPHYYGSHFYNWPYTYGLLFGLGLYAKYQSNPDHFRENYDTVLSRAGMDTAEELGQAFGIDVTDIAFWTSSLDVLRARMLDYEKLAQKHL